MSSCLLVHNRLNESTRMMLENADKVFSVFDTVSKYILMNNLYMYMLAQIIVQAVSLLQAEPLSGW